MAALAAALAAARAAALPGETKMFTPPLAASLALYNASILAAPAYAPIPPPGISLPGPLFRAAVAPAPRWLPPDRKVDMRDVVDSITLRPGTALYQDTFTITLWHFCRILVAHVNSNWPQPPVGGVAWGNGVANQPVAGLMPWNFYLPPIQFDVRPAAAPPACWFIRALADLAALYPVATFNNMRYILFPFREVGVVRIDFLIIVSPYAKTVDYLNSHPFAPLALSPAKNAMGHIMRLVALHVGEGFDARDWKMRLNGSVNFAMGRLCDHNIWLAANAMAILSGYEITFAGQMPLLDNFRARFVHILARGFFSAPGVGDDYSYPILARSRAVLRSVATGFIPCNENRLVNHLPWAARARWYAPIALRPMTTKTDMYTVTRTAHGRGGIYRGLQTWGKGRAVSRTQLKHRIEDENFRELIRVAALAGGTGVPNAAPECGPR